MKAISVISLFLSLGLYSLNLRYIPSTVYKEVIEDKDTISYDRTNIIFSGCNDSISIIYNDSLLYSENVFSNNFDGDSFYNIDNNKFVDGALFKIVRHGNNTYAEVNINKNYKFISLHFYKDCCIQSFRNSEIIRE